MYKTQDIFKLLSSENKALKDDYAYKCGQEGLLRAFYFFRWCNKSEVADTRAAAKRFASGKVPEEIAEHYCTALVMIDHYQTDEEIKNAIKEIDQLTRDQLKDKGVLESLTPEKVKRRILKNVQKSYALGVETLEKRMSMLSSTTRNVLVAMALLLLINLALALTGVYERYLGFIFSGAPNPGYLVAGVLFIVPVFLLLLVKRRQLMEHKTHGPRYPQALKAMKKGLEDFTGYLSEKKII